MVGGPWLVWLVLERGGISNQQPQHGCRKGQHGYFPAPLAEEQGWFCALGREGVAMGLDLVLMFSSRLLNQRCSPRGCRHAAPAWAVRPRRDTAAPLRVVWQKD